MPLGLNTDFDQSMNLTNHWLDVKWIVEYSLLGSPAKDKLSSRIHNVIILPNNYTIKSVKYCIGDKYPWNYNSDQQSVVLGHYWYTYLPVSHLDYLVV